MKIFFIQTRGSLQSLFFYSSLFPYHNNKRTLGSYFGKNHYYVNKRKNILFDVRRMGWGEKQQQEMHIRITFYDGLQCWDFLDPVLLAFVTQPIRHFILMILFPFFRKSISRLFQDESGFFPMISFNSLDPNIFFLFVSRHVQSNERSQMFHEKCLKFFIQNTRQLL